MFGGITDGLRMALRPIRMLNPLALKSAAKHPQETHHLMAEREVYIHYLKPNATEIIGGIRFSNTVFIPELEKGWMIMPKTAMVHEGKPLYLCDPEIPYTLGIRETEYTRDVNEEATPELKEELGLPDTILRLHTDNLGQFCISKWNTAFDEGGGSLMVFIFGGAVGAVLMMLISLLLIAFGGMMG